MMIPITRGTFYGDEAIAGYVKFAHGTDMEVFLCPFIQQDLDGLKGKLMLDAGCGAAPWSIYAAKQGADVIGIDLQEGMILKAQEAIRNAQVSVKVAVGDATRLNFGENSFDHVLSSLVACNLPSEIFANHFLEIGRVLKAGGSATVSTPVSLDIVFMNGSAKPDETANKIARILNDLPDDPSDDSVRAGLNRLDEVVSATFTMNGKRLELVTDLSKLESGQKIWRKLTSVTIPNYFHAESEYTKAFGEACLKLKQVSTRTITSKERSVINATAGIHPTLGVAYEQHPSFKVYHLEK